MSRESSLLSLWLVLGGRAYTSPVFPEEEGVSSEGQARGCVECFCFLMQGTSPHFRSIETPLDW